MSVNATTMFIALTAIVCATVAVCFHVIGNGDWLAIVGGFGGGTAAAHIGVNQAAKGAP